MSSPLPLWLRLLTVSVCIGRYSASLPEVETKCGHSEECVKNDQCQQFLEKKQEWENMEEDSSERSKLLEELKEVVCNKIQKGVCCERNPTEGRHCLTNQGYSGTCQTWARCTPKDSFYSVTCGTDTACCTGSREEEEEEVSVRSITGVRSEPPNKVDRRGLCGVDGAVPYVFGGVEAKEGQFPFVASLVWTSSRSRKVRSFCGGVKITSRHILTAAHCFRRVSQRDIDNNKIDVRIGLTNLRSREKPGNSANIAKVKIHDGYGPAGVGVKNDIAIITLDRDTEGPSVCLPGNDDRSWSNRSAVIVGWGRTTKLTWGPSEEVLRYANLEEYSVDECQSKYDTLLRRNLKKVKLTDKQLCAGNEEADACAGDSGGPLLHLNSGHLWMVAGIVSFGPSSCAKEVPGVYTKVSSYIDWINRIISS